MRLKSCHARVGMGLAAVLMATPALAALKDRGPVAPIGFPLWYRDNGIPAAGVSPAVAPTALELCTAATPSPNAGAAGAPMCFPWVPDPAGFPGNISGEIFYAVADAATAGPGYDIRLVTALEAAYATGTPVRGSEIVFARVRIVMNVQTAGTYTVTHPFGVEIFKDVQPGTRAVFFTSDIGATGVQFDGALGGAVGPFLRWDVLAPGEILTITTATATEEYLGDPNLLHTITGSPFGSNFLRVDRLGDLAATAQTNLFTVVGKKYTAPIPTPLAVTRATYSRTAGTAGAASLDVFATANPGQQLVIADQNAAAPAITPTIAAANASSYLGHFVLGPAELLPTTVTVTNTTDVPANVVTANVTDLVTISDAFYDPASQVLTVQAFSSDSAAPPALNLAGFGAVDAAGRTFAAGAVPPETVIVSSSAGGSDTHPVRVLQSLAVAPGNTSLAANDTFTTNANTPATFDVIANDTITSPLAAVIITSPPAHGTAVAGAVLGTVLYTPALNYNGPDSFAYTLQNTAGALSNVASAAITVTFVALPPTAVNDLLTTAAGVTNTAAILANDTAAVGTTLVPSSVVLGPLTPAGAGTIAYSAATQLVTFTPAAGFTGAASATYTVSNNFAQPSNVATINIQVNAAAEVINITRAQFRTGTSRWTVTGTSTVLTGGTVTIFNGSTAAAPVIGTAPIVGGAFTFDLVGGPPPSASRLILIQSSNGGSRVAAVTIRL